jgi:predicted O-methyltransferase YrrM
MGETEKYEMKFTMKQIQTTIDDVLSGDISIENEYFKMLMRESYENVGHDQPYYSVFYILASQLKPSFVVELGSWRGFASAAFALGNPKARVVTIDIHREDKFAQQRCLQIERDIPNFTYINAWTWDAVTDVEALGLPIDILYIDAWHEYQYAIKEWNLYSPLLANNALVICDDIFDSVGTTELMEKFWGGLPGKGKFLNSAIHPGIPMGFMRFVK